jgi:hypothetical protein
MQFVRPLEGSGTINVPGRPSIFHRVLALSARPNILLIMQRILAIGALWVVFIPQAAAAALPPSAEEIEHWKGRYCTTPSCAPGSQNPWSAAIGFGTATLAAGWIGRPRTPQSA